MHTEKKTFNPENKLRNFMSKGTTRRSIDLSCVWLALMLQSERTREVMLSFFVWMLAGFIIRVCLACGRPQHAVGFHYVVYSYIVFVLFLHRTWRRKELLLVSSVKWMVKAEAEARLQVRISSSP